MHLRRLASPARTDRRERAPLAFRDALDSSPLHSDAKCSTTRSARSGDTLADADLVDMASCSPWSRKLKRRMSSRGSRLSLSSLSIRAHDLKNVVLAQSGGRERGLLLPCYLATTRTTPSRAARDDELRPAHSFSRECPPVRSMRGRPCSSSSSLRAAKRFVSRFVCGFDLPQEH